MKEQERAYTKGFDAGAKEIIEIANRMIVDDTKPIGGVYVGSLDGSMAMSRRYFRGARRIR